MVVFIYIRVCYCYLDRTLTAATKLMLAVSGLGLWFLNYVRLGYYF